MTVLFFFIISSALYNYGLGLHVVLLKKQSLKTHLIHFGQISAELVLSLVLSWLVIQKLLVPFQLTALFPLVVFLIFYLVHSFIRLFLEKFTTDISKEQFIPLLILILSFLHSTTLPNALIVASSCLISYFLAIPILHAIYVRISQTYPLPTYKMRALILISISVIMLALYAFDLSWLFN